MNCARYHSRDTLTLYRIYDVQDHDKVVGDYTIHEASEIIGMSEKTIRTVMCRCGILKKRYFITRVGEKD